jgi:hypothetical protein
VHTVLGVDTLESGAIARRLLPAIVLAIVVATAALPVTATAAAAATSDAASASDTPDPCAGAPATVAAEQAAFTTLDGLGGGWSTADGYVPVALPDQRTAWLMSDTLLAPPAVDDAAGPTFVHNSIVVQRGHCFTPVMGGDAAARVDLVPTVDDRACWQSAGVARGTTLVVFCTDVVSAEGPPGFGFQVVGTSLATFDLPGLGFTGRVPLPFVEPAGIRWGTGAARDGDWVYVYGVATGAQYVSRVRFDRIATGPWQFWSGAGWGARDALAAMTFADGTPVMPAFVTSTPTGYVAVAFASAFPDPTIGGWTATAPQGPWQPLGTVATATLTGEQYAYDARAVDLGPAGWAVVYNVNDPVTVATGPSVYGGRFVPAPPAMRGAVQGATKRCSGACAPSLVVT